MKKSKNITKKKIAAILMLVSMLIAAPFTKVSIDFSHLFAYGAEQITGLEKSGDQITKTHSDGQDWTFTSPINATYTIELFGPKANGNNAGNGGSVSTNISLNEGDTVDVYLGPGAPESSGARDASKGCNGSGYGDSEPYKSVVKVNGVIYMVAGGGGAQGNPGTGDGSNITPGTWSSCKDRNCPLDDGNATHYKINGIGGAGGAGADGGGSTVAIGENGKAGSEAYWYSHKNTPSRHEQYFAGGMGGAGGNGGASYVNPSCVGTIFASGLGFGESKAIIAIGEEKFPDLDSKLLVDAKTEIIQTLSDKISQIGTTSSGDSTIPQITVIKGKSFQKLISSYPDMESGNSGGVSVENDDKTNATISISGMLNTAGSQEIIIHGNSFIFHVIEEPDSANVTVMFD